MHKNRGLINNRARAKQLRDYSGLRFGNITPTDLDGVIEYHNKAYLILELKYEDPELYLGQRLALERITDDLEYRKPTLCIIASHYQHNPSKDIDAANASVTEYRLKGEWIKISQDSTITTRNIMDLFLEDLDIGSKALQFLCARNQKANHNLSKYMGVQ